MFLFKKNVKLQNTKFNPISSKDICPDLSQGQICMLGKLFAHTFETELLTVKVFKPELVVSLTTFFFKNQVT